MLPISIADIPSAAVATWYQRRVFLQVKDGWRPHCIGIPTFAEDIGDDGYRTIYVRITHQVCPGCGGAGGWMYAPGYCDAYDDCETCGGKTKISVAA